MFNTDDQTQLAAGFEAIKNDNPTTITITRNGSSIGSQTARIVLAAGSGSKKDGPSSQQSEVTLLIIGAVGLDIQPDDRFAFNGSTVLVTAVLPNRLVNTQATAVYEH